ncbi:MAG: sulfurtransferase [Alphaproteobacteria bacterium]|nr:sulfurtransferase [Alphaproteobacteria bacterium]
MDLPHIVSVLDVKGLFDSKADFCLIDVRQDWEFELCHIENSLHLPLDQLAEKLHEIPTDKPLYTLCHHGIRSGHAAILLKNAGFKDVSNIKGGIDAWAKEIDSTLKTY